MSMNQDEIERSSREILGRFSEVEMEAPAFLKPRVLSELHSRKKMGQQLFFWRLLGSGGLAFGGAMVILLLLMPRETTFPWGVRTTGTDAVTEGTLSFIVSSDGAGMQAPARQPVTFLLQLPADGSRIARAKIVLPEGVVFRSEKHPQLRDQRSVTLDLKKVGSAIPIVIEGETAGTKTITALFTDSAGTTVSERRFEVQFTP
jgi:hypothetical protein